MNLEDRKCKYNFGGLQAAKKDVEATDNREGLTMGI